MKNTTISTRPITDLLTDGDGNPTRFWIPAYQRGYRWKPLQVTHLLDDVWEFIPTSTVQRSIYLKTPYKSKWGLGQAVVVPSLY